MIQLLQQNLTGDLENAPDRSDAYEVILLERVRTVFKYELTLKYDIDNDLIDFLTNLISVSSPNICDNVEMFSLSIHSGQDIQITPPPAGVGGWGGARTPPPPDVLSDFVKIFRDAYDTVMNSPPEPDEPSDDSDEPGILDPFDERWVDSDDSDDPGTPDDPFDDSDTPKVLPKLYKLPKIITNILFKDYMECCICLEQITFDEIAMSACCAGSYHNKCYDKISKCSLCRSVIIDASSF